MKSVAEIKQAIKQLPERQRKMLSRWLAEQQNKAWDDELNEDASAGKLQFLVDEAAAARKARKLTKFP
jgi:hypothetical protein